MAKDGFTTGQASGITHVPAGSIWRYVEDYEAHFSPTAKQGRGRRFSLADIRVILIIRQMYTQRKKKTEVRQALEEGNYDLLPEHYDLASIGALANDINTQCNQVKEVLSDAEETRWRLKNQSVLINQELDRFRKILAKYDERIAKLEFDLRLGRSAEKERPGSWVEKLRSKK